MWRVCPPLVAERRGESLVAKIAFPKSALVGASRGDELGGVGWADDGAGGRGAPS
jgi:hypothetical protein